MELTIDGDGLLWERSAEDLLRDRHVRVILAELERLGVKWRAGVPAIEVPLEIFDPTRWTIRETLWRRLLEPLPEKDLARVEKHFDKFAVVRATTEDNPDIYQRGFQHAFEPGARAAIEREMHRAALAGFGALLVNHFFDSFKATATVRLPGRLLRTNGTLTGDGGVRWVFSPKDVLANPELRAWSFVPAKGYEDRVFGFDALLKYRAAWRAAGSRERALVAKHLAGEKVYAKDDEFPALDALRELLD